MMHPTIFEAIMIAEGATPPASKEEYLEAWQLLVDDGIGWQLQGWFGRRAHALIEEGAIDRPDPVHEQGRTH